MAGLMMLMMIMRLLSTFLEPFFKVLSKTLLCFCVVFSFAYFSGSLVDMVSEAIQVNFRM